MDLLNKNKKICCSLRLWVNPAYVPYQAFFSFLLPFFLYHTPILYLVLLLHGVGIKGGWEVKRSSAGCRCMESLVENNWHDSKLAWSRCILISHGSSTWLYCAGTLPTFNYKHTSEKIKWTLLRPFHLFSLYNHIEIFIILHVNNCERADWLDYRYCFQLHIASSPLWNWSLKFPRNVLEFF